MKVKDLISQLKQLPRDAEVVMSDESTLTKDAVEIDVADIEGDLFNYCMEQGFKPEDRVRVVILKA